jgi:hypothetical protein
MDIPGEILGKGKPFAVLFFRRRLLEKFQLLLYRYLLFFRLSRATLSTFRGNLNMLTLLPAKLDKLSGIPARHSGLPGTHSGLLDISQNMFNIQGRFSLKDKTALK